MTETKAHQLKHAKCKHKASFEDASKWKASLNEIYECKYDGHRFFLQVRPNKAKINYLTSRHVSVEGGYTEKQNKIPRIRDYRFSKSIGRDTVFDGEITGGEISTDTSHSIANGEGDYFVWDIIRFKGEDIREWPLRKRLRLLRSLEPHFPKWMKRAFNLHDPAAMLEHVQATNGEGMIRKDLNVSYGEGWTKVKRAHTEDAIIFGYEETKSDDWKEKGWIGAVRIGMWKRISHREIGNYTKWPKMFQPKLRNRQWYGFVDVGRCSGFTAKIREKISKNRANFIGQIIEVECDIQLRSNKFRSPRFNRFRDDKNESECLIQ